MPKVTKETDELTNKSISKTNNKSEKAATKKSSSSRKSSDKTKSLPGEKTTKTLNKNTNSKTNSKADSKTSSKVGNNKTKKTTKKSTSIKNANKAVKSSTTKKTSVEKVSVIEYYDLPYRYNQTTVKILAQTPNMLFVYWDISDEDKAFFENKYGSDFFSKTKPVLLVHNLTMNYYFELEINDFANSWYLHVNDANCKYVIELGRKPYKYIPSVNENYIYVSSSNEMNAPNNHILFEKFNPNVEYKNTKTGMTYNKDFSNFANYKNMQKIYNIYDLYKKIYKDELFDELKANKFSNPSSDFR